MGLQLTLDKTKNRMYYTFEDAYWAISNVSYTPEVVSFLLRAYPNRESKLMDRQLQTNPRIGLGEGEDFVPYGSGDSTVSSDLYTWNIIQPLSTIFSEGIPLDRDSQYTSIYNWIKEYTKLPWKDVIEKEEN